MFKSAHANTSDWKAGVESCLAALGELPSGDGAPFGFVYVTETLSQDLENILPDLRERTGITHWVGSVGLGVCALTKTYCGEFFDEPAMVMMTANLPVGSFTLFPNFSEDGAEGSTPSSDTNGLEGLPFVVAHADTSNPDILTLVEDLAESTGGFLVGGLTASQTANHHIAGDMTGGGVSGVVFSPDVPVMTSLSQGCQPLGEIHTVTQASDNMIFELDDQPALEVLLDDCGVESVTALQTLAGDIHAALPVQGSDTGDYMVRNLMGVDQNHGVVAIGAPVEDGDAMLFVRRDGEAAEQDLRQTFQKLKCRAGENIKGGLYISCIARGPHMFGTQNAELELIRDIFGDIPLVGMYANGEISNNRLYSYTGVLTLFV